MVFQWSCMDVRVDYKESWDLKNWCFWTMVLEKTLERPLDFKEMQPFHPKENQSWMSLEGLVWGWNAKTLATSCKALTHLKRPWWWESLRAGGEGDDRGWDDWMASPTQWTWVCGLHELVMDRESWQAAVHGLTKIWTQLSDWTELRMLNIVSDFFPFFFFLLVFFGLVFDGQYFCFSLEDIPLWM